MVRHVRAMEIEAVVCEGKLHARVRLDDRRAREGGIDTFGVHGRADLIEAFVVRQRAFHFEFRLREGLMEVRRDTETDGAIAFEDIDFLAHGRRSFGHALQHGVHEGGEDVTDFGEEEGEESVVAVAKDGEEFHEFVEMISRS
jgi:hypothetical protein